MLLPFKPGLPSTPAGPGGQSRMVVEPLLVKTPGFPGGPGGP